MEAETESAVATEVWVISGWLSCSLMWFGTCVSSQEEIYG